MATTLTISVRNYGEVSIIDNQPMAERLSILRQRVSRNAARTPVGKRLWQAVFAFNEHMRLLAETQHGPLHEGHAYHVTDVSLEKLEEAERINATGKASAQRQGPLYRCVEYGCQNQVRTQGSRCARCEHDA